MIKLVTVVAQCPFPIRNALTYSPQSLYSPICHPFATASSLPVNENDCRITTRLQIQPQELLSLGGPNAPCEGHTNMARDTKSKRSSSRWARNFLRHDRRGVHCSLHSQWMFSFKFSIFFPRVTSSKSLPRKIHS